MLLNAALSSGVFRSILVYKGQRQQNSRDYPLATYDPANFVALIGMTKHIAYLIKVIGVFVLRLRPGFRESGTILASYRTSTVDPFIFCCMSLLIIAWSAAERPMNIVAILAVFGGGLLIDRSTCYMS